MDQNDYLEYLEIEEELKYLGIKLNFKSIENFERSSLFNQESDRVLKFQLPFKKDIRLIEVACTNR